MFVYGTSTRTQFSSGKALPALAVAVALLGATAAHAAEQERPGVSLAQAGDGNSNGPAKDHYYVALGPVVTPDYAGSDDDELQPLLIARWIRRGAYLEFRADTVTANLIPASVWQAGPVARWHRGRDDVDDARVDRMREIDGALEVGGFAGFMLRDLDELRRRLGLHLQVLQDVTGAHEGYEATLRLRGGSPFGDGWSLDGEVAARYGSGDFMDTYFSVDADNARRSGLARYDADAGFHDVGVSLMLSYAFSDRWGLGLVGGYRRMVGEAADSPLVDDAGSPHQVDAGLVLTWTY